MITTSGLRHVSTSWAPGIFMTQTLTPTATSACQHMTTIIRDNIEQKMEDNGDVYQHQVEKYVYKICIIANFISYSWLVY